MIDIIIVNYFSFEKVQRLIQSIDLGDPRFRVCIIDNSGNSAEFKRISSIDHRLIAIDPDCNGGFSVGTNVGIKLSVSDLSVKGVLILNPDTILTDTFLDRLWDSSNTYPDSAISPMGLRLKGKTIWSNGGRFYWLRGRADVLISDDKAVRKTEFGTCACLYVPLELIKDIGFLDEDYFLGGEEWDFSNRLNKKYGIYADPNIVYLHEISGTHAKYGPKFFYMGMRTKLLFVSKTYKFPLVWLILFLISLPLIYSKNKTIHGIHFKYFLFSIKNAICKGLRKQPITEEEFSNA